MPKLSSYDDTGFDTSISIRSKNKLSTSDSLAQVAGDNRNVVIDVAASRAATDNAAAVTTAGGASTDIKNTNEHWVNNKWRPMMGWMYMFTCIFDFVLAPIGWAIIQALEASTGGQVAVQWQPLTLQGAGLYHVAMGAVIGVTAFGRTKEKTHNLPSNGSALGQLK
jgi:hypothetical protein